MYIYGLNFASYYSRSVPAESYLKLLIIEKLYWYLNPAYLIFKSFSIQYLRNNIINAICISLICRTSFNYGWCPFYRELPRIHPDAISSDGVRPKQTNTDLSGLRLEERGFRVKRVALAATSTPRLKANKSHHGSSPLHGSFCDAFHFISDITVTHFYCDSPPPNQDLAERLLFNQNFFVFKDTFYQN